MTTHAEKTSTPHQATFPRTTPEPALPPELPPGAIAPARAAAGRRTTRRALIISVLVVLAGGLIAFAGAQMLTKHTRVLAVARDVPIGATITGTDLTVASVTKDPNISPIPASHETQIVGMVAQVGLVKGELLTLAQVSTRSGFAPGQMLVALPLKPGQFPARGLMPGQNVLIVATPGANGSSGAERGAPSNSSTSRGRSSSPGVDGTVADVGTMNQATQITVVDVRVPSSEGPAVAQLASTGNLAVILLPAGR